jgi:hypothetical protein
MNVLRLLLLALLLAGPARAEPPAEPAPSAGPATTVNIAAHYVDAIFADTLAALELIAATPEAQQGDWPGIKRSLQRLEAHVPGAYFHVLPDGNYHSVTLDRTGLNLADRPYFKTLMAGETVRGFPIFSRSSGRKSALVAAPIVVDGRVTGALGASIFLDDLHARLDREFALPPGHLWYVLDATGNTLLHGDADFIFLNALERGSPSLRAALAGALQCECGEFDYMLGKARHAYYQKLPTMDWWMFLVEVGTEAESAPPKAMLSLDRFAADLQARLDAIDGSLARLIAAQPPAAAREGRIRRLLADFLAENADVVDASFVDDRGVLRQIEPSEYRNLENADLAHREHVVAMLRTRQPVFSGGFRAFEGFLAVDLARPLRAADGSFLGSVSAFLRPELFIDPLLRKSAVPPEHEIWIMQPDGLIVFDQDRDEIGRMLFSDPLYAGFGQLLELGRTIAATPAGEGSYVFLAPGLAQPVIKRVRWQTVGLHGREWRVVLGWRPYEP